jgi:two-component system, NtrC family, sensor histidine kinase GlrK
MAIAAHHGFLADAPRRMKKSLRPTSVLQLVLIAFALVGVPLIIALVTATVAVDRLALQSRESVRKTAQVIDAGRALVEDITVMERIALQYQLLGDPDLFESYLRRRAQYLRTVETLMRPEISAAYEQALATLVAAESEIHAVLSSRRPDAPEVRAAMAEFPVLVEDARRILADSSHAIGREVGELRRQADETQRRLFWQALAVIPAAFVLAILGILLIARPIRQVEHAIRRLGSGHFETPVNVEGPRDLEELGERLEWLRQRLLELDAQKVRFLRHISHELKTPLTAIREGAQLLSDEVPGRLTPAQQEIAGILCHNSMQLQRRIEDLLGFDTIVRGLGGPASHEPVEVRPLLDQVLNDQVVSIKAKRLEIAADAEPLVIPGDREQLRIVLDNLLSNAIKYSPAGGRVHVHMRRRNGHALIEVRDEGPGIRPEERAKVFQPFYQGSAMHDGHVKGTGLGLSITQEYVRSHHGNIEIADIERGACLRVTLPLADERGATEASATQS